MSLEMKAEIAPFSRIYLDRITQLINKTNQFNLTTRRYTTPEVKKVAEDSSYVTLYGRLADRFGDNGLVSVLIGHIVDHTVEVELWLMSCRVFNRDMELAMFDALVEQCRRRGIRRIIGTYTPSSKNGLVAEFYRQLGFGVIATGSEGQSTWAYDLPENWHERSRYISRTAPANAGDSGQALTGALTESHAGAPMPEALTV